MNKKSIEKEKIISTLDGDGAENRFYVYALCDENHSPFYIGKGAGGRVWAHEEGKEKETEEIEKKSVSKEEKEKMLEELSEKYKKIDEIGKDKVEKVIIKWGLTEPEAFMAESALINLCNYPDNTLTNVVSGHASEAEKKNGIEFGNAEKTKARSVNAFLEDCCKELLILEKSDIVNPEGESVLKEFGKIKILFINIGDNYSKCKGESDEGKDWEIMETARGCWKMAEKRTPDYLFATNNSIIRGVYKIKEIKSVLDVNIEEKEEKEEKSVLDVNTEEKENDFRKFPEELKERELEVIGQLKENPDVDSIEKLSDGGKAFRKLIDNDKSDSRNKRKKGKKINYDDELKKWKQRKYIICEPVDEKTKGIFCGKVIKKRKTDGYKSIFGSGNPIKYNY